MRPTFPQELIALGFVEEGTGGGCTALVLRRADGHAMYITDGDLQSPLATDPEWAVWVEWGNEEEDNSGAEWDRAGALLPWVRRFAANVTPSILTTPKEG